MPPDKQYGRESEEDMTARRAELLLNNNRVSTRRDTASCTKVTGKACGMRACPVGAPEALANCALVSFSNGLEAVSGDNYLPPVAPSPNDEA